MNAGALEFLSMNIDGEGTMGTGIIVLSRFSGRSGHSGRDQYGMKNRAGSWRDPQHDW
jgi:hypothetical protein